MGQGKLKAWKSPKNGEDTQWDMLGMRETDGGLMRTSLVWNCYDGYQLMCLEHAA
jgi:hypothetical protein